GGCAWAGGGGEYFANGVVRAVHIRVDAPPIRCSIKTTLHALATEGGNLLVAVDRQSVRVEEARLAGVALLAEAHLDADQLGFVGQHLDEARMGHLDEVLVVALA